ncbi:unnamed protein product [Phaedon cochleariae]|uniref:Protein sleepless n=1 Tax=Phaedon cochleariae TaxID=80249 RepID=A0A9N9SDS8_PHACE|nr:unnamed protein product [Phaedon cochleariae]
MQMCPNGFLVLLGVICLVENSNTLDCYQCSGSDSDTPFQCNEWLSSDIDITPQACDKVYGAKYCIKHVGRFEGAALKCYQCSASASIDCSDGMIQMGGGGGMVPQSCDHVFGAQYCIKTTSYNNGGIGAKRFCSSLDLGNYCNYVQQPGDTLTYRTCVYTCTGDGCNTGTFTKPNVILMISLGLFVREILF